MNGKIFQLLSIILLSYNLLYSQDLPIGYVEQYSNRFIASPDTILASSGNTRISAVDESGKKYMKIESLHADSALFPFGQVILSDQLYGEFIMNFEVFVSEKDSIASDGLFLLVGIRDSSNYYCIQINKDSVFFYRKYNGILKRLPVNGHLNITPGSWQKLSVQRNMLNRSFTISNNNNVTILQDASLVMGYIGFGTNYLIGIDNIQIWAPTSIKARAPLFYLKDTLYHDY